MGITCTPLIDIKSIMQPLLLSSMLKKEGEVPIDALLDVYIQDIITSKLLQNVDLPTDFQDFGDVICLSLEMNKVKYLQAVLKGETPPEMGIDKTLELVVNIQLISAIANAFGGSSGATG